jgi:hypothetical protein
MQWCKQQLQKLFEQNQLKELLKLLFAPLYAKVPDPPWSMACCYQLFCRVVVKLTSAKS